MNNKAVIGMSGGVDSSVAAALLLKAGYEVIGATMWLWDGSEAAEDAKKIAEKLGIQHHILDFREQFKRHVTDYFISEYKNGRTPNPCVVCNRKIKFESLLKAAESFGAEYIATGHYARIEERNGRHILVRPADRKKDQTYFLYNLTQNQLSRTLMPLSGITKEQAREIAADLGLSVADKKDSQEICFIPEGHYADFIEKVAGKSPEGDFVDMQGNVLGRHKGIIHYTVGQRKGLGIALGVPVFVSRIDPLENRVYLGMDGCQISDTVYAKKLNYISSDKKDDSFRCSAKIRYNAKEASCTVFPEGDRVKAVFDTPQRSATPGQSVVFYHDDIVIGGGTII